MMNRPYIQYRWILGFALAGLLLSTDSIMSIGIVDGPLLSIAYAIHVTFACSVFGFLAGAAGGVRRWWYVVFLSLMASFLVFSLRLNFLDAVLELSPSRYVIAFITLWIVMSIVFWFGLDATGRFRKRLTHSVFIVLAVPVCLQAITLAGNQSSDERTDDSAIRVSPSGTLSNGWSGLVLK